MPGGLSVLLYLFKGAVPAARASLCDQMPSFASVTESLGSPLPEVDSGWTVRTRNNRTRKREARVNFRFHLLRQTNLLKLFLVSNQVGTRCFLLLYRGNDQTLPTLDVEVAIDLRSAILGFSCFLL
jgi:hypothetical protein